ncbi:adenosine deaminase [Frankia casuarinae]|jgi:adenosine deaminase|uniref:Adenosine deaminase n=2 Tax=Frankia casuarinae (strain DSM 45818 / CECT 9043 / HFP020203 / CcI3) TaxID=106370 RepID=Q2JAE3_FRACC|nr:MULTISPECIES: adenosine deaminase [Frankia]ABD11749.1 adenosine deaminase [Frankia casuarinae]ETA03414.1 adenosine deaminase [Frankia sp. CcI6]EYT93191.1 adenosine deaminase [Frankia casuarinae]KDA42690.1 adenosine deaminase [Frankia sp. BMG5.23]KFB04126.1 adenosine deaminase [Frankia sp. Allo2]
MHSLLHCHFESALRALEIAKPERVGYLRGVYETDAYLQSTPAERLTLLWQTVMSLTDDADIFTEATFRRVVRRLLDEMQASRIEHIDLRIGPSTGRWRWMHSAGDGIDIFREELSYRTALSITFLAGVNMTKTQDQLDALFDVLSEQDDLTTRIAGVDLNFLPYDLPKFNRYLRTLRNLQTGGMKVNIHLGELFNNAISHYVLARITPDRIGHGVLLLDDEALVDFVRANGICLDMCPTSNTLLGVADWNRTSPARVALQLGIPVSINTDDPVLFRTSLESEFSLAGLTGDEYDQVIACGRKYRYGDA